MWTRADPVRDPLEMVEDAQATASVDRRLRDARIGSAHPLVIVHVSAGNPFRRWPHESFETLVIALARRDPSRRIILTSGPSDAPAAKGGRRPRACRARRLRRRRAGCRRIRPRRTARAGRARRGVTWGRQRAASHRRNDDDTDRGAARTDTRRAIDAVAGSAMVCRSG